MTTPNIYTRAQYMEDSRTDGPSAHSTETSHDLLTPALR